ncbi:unnamed protein product, partial [Effrenium voratum]
MPADLQRIILKEIEGSRHHKATQHMHTLTRSSKPGRLSSKRHSAPVNSGRNSTGAELRLVSAGEEGTRDGVGAGKGRGQIRYGLTSVAGAAARVRLKVADRRAASLTSAHKARSPAKAARPRAQAKAEPRRPARGKARSDLSQSFSSASKAQWAEECSKEDRWDKAWELQEENRSLRALAERLQLQLAAVEESERRYQAELAGVDTETDEE